MRNNHQKRCLDKYRAKAYEVLHKLKDLEFGGCNVSFYNSGSLGKVARNHFVHPETGINFEVLMPTEETFFCGSITAGWELYFDSTVPKSLKLAEEKIIETRALKFCT